MTRIIDTMRKIIEESGEPSSDESAEVLNVDQILNERGRRYGVFVEHALITQNLKSAMRHSPNWHNLPEDMKECLEMVAHKIGRILNGDPMYADSWVDITGYAQLVVDRLGGRQR